MTRIESYELPQYLADRQAAKRSDRSVQIACSVLALLCIVGSGMILPRMNAMRRDYQFLADPESVKGLPPMEALMAKTGTFRALALDVAFIRAEKLKQEGKFFEAMQLADWICQLAPRFPSVWAFNAWNQAYNISVAKYTPEERWMWVKNGIELLRDKGIQYNPKSVTLYKELAWLYIHKIGDFLDDQHRAYKAELAVEMERVLGAPPIVTTEAEAIDAFRPIAESDGDVDKLIAQDREVAALVDRLRAVGLKPDHTVLEFVAREVRDDKSVVAELEAMSDEEAIRQHAQRLKMLVDPASIPARDRLLAAIRSHILRTRYHMDPQWMVDLMDYLGPLDWRSPFSQALYWSSKGDIETRGAININETDAMNTVRFIFFSLDQLVKRGRIILEPNFDQPNQSYLELLPDLRFIKYYHQTVLEQSKLQFPNDPMVQAGAPGPNYAVGHFNFLFYAITQLYLSGDPASMAEAREYYNYMREFNTHDDGTPKEEFNVPFREYVEKNIDDIATSFKTATAVVTSMMQRAIQELLAGRNDRFDAILQQANNAYERYHSDTDTDRTNRRTLEKFPILMADTVRAFMRSPAVPTMRKARLWRLLAENRTLLRVQQMIWDDTHPFFRELCLHNDPPLELERTFPEPPDMETYRANPEQRRDVKTPDISEGEQE